MATKKETVQTKDEQGKELVLDVKYPSGKVIQDANLIYTTHWQTLVEGDPERGIKPVKVRSQIADIMKEKGIWTDKHEEERKRLEDKIIELGRKLRDKKVKKTKAEGRNLAIEILKVRSELRNLLAEKNANEANSAESLAENVRFDYLVSVCTVYNTNGEPYFKDYEDYVARREEQAAWDAASKLATMVYGGVDFTEKYEDSLIELQFLKQFGFLDSEKDLLNTQGEKVDIDDKPLRPKDEDPFGNKIVDGKVQFTFEGFEDDEPEVKPEVKAEPTPTPKPKATPAPKVQDEEKEEVNE